MNRKAFFAHLRSRSSGVFGTSLSQAQVDGINAILTACSGLSSSFTAYCLATAYHETARSMQPIKETVMPYHKDKNPSDAEVIRRLDNAYAKGRLGQVYRQYWRNGWFGRGYVQLTHKDNYREAGKLVGKNLVGNPDLAMLPHVAAEILVVGSVKGMFTGRKLGDYLPGDYRNARKVINGLDKADVIAGYARAFESALLSAGSSANPAKPAFSWGDLIAAIFRGFKR